MYVQLILAINDDTESNARTKRSNRWLRCLKTGELTVRASLYYLTLDAHCCHIMGTAIKHPVPDRAKPSFVIFDIRALWRSALSVRVPGCQTLQMTA